MPSCYYLPRPQHTDNYGNLIIQGRLNFFEAGNPGVPKAVYLDPELTTECSNPLELDAAGRTPDEVPVVYYGAGEYMVTLENYVSGSWVEVWQAPNISGTPAASGSSSVGEVVVNTILDLKQVDVDTYTRAFVLGSVGVSSGGGGHYYWSSTASDNDDGGWYIQRASGGAGRWIRLAEAGLDRLDIRIWGAVSNVGPIDSNYAAASAISAMLRLPVSFPYGNWLFQDDTTITGAVIIGKGAKFGFVSTSSAYTINFNGKTVVESTESIFLIAAMYVIFGASSGMPFVDTAWGYDPDGSAKVASDSGLPLFVSSAVTLASNWSEVVEIIVGVKGFISTGTYSITCERFTVQGDQRQVIDSAGSVLISKMNEHQAWWYGYGVGSGTNHSTYLAKAATAAQENGAALAITANMVNASIATTIIFYCPVRILEPITLATGADLTFLKLVDRPNVRLFIFNDFSASAVILDGEIDPVWYGASPFETAANNQNALQKCLDSAGTSWVNGYGRVYQHTGYLVLPSPCYAKNIKVQNTDGYGSLQNTTGKILKLRDVISQSSAAGINALQMIFENTLADVDIQGCQFIGGFNLYAYGTLGNIRIVDNRVSDGVTTIKTSENQNTLVTGNNFEKVAIVAGTAQYGNVNFNGNTLQGNTSDILDVSTDIPETVVRNFSIQNNTIRWTGAAADTILINPVLVGSGTFRDWQAARVAGNVCISTHTVPAAYPDLGAVTGPWCSSTSGSDVVEFPQGNMSNPLDTDLFYFEQKEVRVGPMFVANKQTVVFNSPHCGIAGEINAEQVIGTNSDGVEVEDTETDVSGFWLMRSNSNPLGGDGRWLQVRAACKYHFNKSNASSYWVRPRAVITWGERCDIGRASKAL